MPSFPALHPSLRGPIAIAVPLVGSSTRPTARARYIFCCFLLRSKGSAGWVWSYFSSSSCFSFFFLLEVHLREGPSRYVHRSMRIELQESCRRNR